MPIDIRKEQNDKEMMQELAGLELNRISEACLRRSPPWNLLNICLSIASLSHFQQQSWRDWSCSEIGSVLQVAQGPAMLRLYCRPFRFGRAADVEFSVRTKADQDVPDIAERLLDDEPQHEPENVDRSKSARSVVSCQRRGGP